MNISPRAIPFLAAFCLLSALVPAAARVDDMAVRKEITLCYVKISTAYEHKDAAAMAAMMSDDFTGVGPDGKPAHKDQVVADFKGQMMSMSDVVWKRGIKTLSIDSTGKMATVTVDGLMTGKMKGKDGKDHKLKLETTAEDIWVKTGAGWKVSHSKVLKFQMSVDGKMNPAR